jgi:DNA-binding CsgD family transcriptional regulator
MLANPHTIAAQRLPPGRARLGSSVVDPISLRRSGMYADIFVPQRIVDLVNLCHPSMHRESTVGGVAITLDSRQSRQGLEAEKRMHRLAPHLLRAVDLSFEVRRNRTAAHSLLALMNVMPTAALLLDATGRVRHFNRRADVLVSDAKKFILDSGGELKTTSAIDSMRLRSAIYKAIGIAKGQEHELQEALRLECTTGGPPFLILLTPLPRVLLDLWDSDDSVLVLVQIIEPGSRQAEKKRLLRQAYNLTPAEAKVAALIAAGNSTPRAAEILGVTVNTVRSQLAQTFAKTGTRSQVELTKILSALA